MAAWRPMTAADLDGLLQVADAVHPDLPEGAHVFAERLGLFPAGCLVLGRAEEEEEDGGSGGSGAVVGYALSHPIRRHAPPALDASLGGALAPAADQYYIHDVAVLPALRGRGHAAAAVRRLLAGVAAPYATTALVSVYGTAPFWARFGFRPERVEGMRKKLGAYGDDAVYLMRRNHTGELGGS